MLMCGLLLHTYTWRGLCCGWSQAGQVSAAECQEVKKALEDGALDVLAPGSTSQPEVVEFRDRVLRWIDQLNQPATGSSTGTPLLKFSLVTDRVCGEGRVATRHGFPGMSRICAMLSHVPDFKVKSK